MIAISASGACRLPTWRWFSPCWPRMKTSQSGHSLDMVLSLNLVLRLARVPGDDGLFGGLRPAGGGLLGMGHQPLAEPGAVLPGLDARAQPVLFARPVAGDHVEEFRPVRLAEIVDALFLVPFQVRVGHGQAQIFR